MYRILLLVLILNQISAQDSIEWIIQSKGESRDFVDDVGFSNESNHAVQSGRYHFATMILQDSAFTLNNPLEFTASYIAHVNSYGQICWTKKINYPTRLRTDIDLYGNTFVSGKVDARNVVINRDTFIDENIKLENGEQSFIAKFDSTGFLEEKVIFKSKRANWCQAQYYDEENLNLHTAIFSQSTDTLFFQDTFVVLKENGISVALLKWSQDLELIKIIPVVPSFRIESHSSICIDNDENTYFAGSFRGDWIELNGDTVIYSDIQNEALHQGIILKLDKEGKLLWYKMFRSTDADALLNRVIVGNSGIYFCGSFNGNELIFSGDTILNGFEYNDNYFHYLQGKLDHDGRLIWANGYDLNTHTIPYMDMNNSDRILTHWVINRDSVKLLGNVHHRENPGLKRSDAILTIQDFEGDLIWAYKYGGELTEIPGAVKLTDDGDVIISGIYESDSLQFFNDTLYNENPRDRRNTRPPKVFFGRVTPDITTSVFDVFPDLETISIRPNPNDGRFTIQELRDDDEVKVYNTAAHQVPFDRSYENISLRDPTPGIYVVIVKHKDGSSSYGKLVVGE